MVRLRQIVLAARDPGPVVAALREALGLGEPFRDPAVSAFGLRNAVMALGDTFVEVVSPVEPGTAAGRHLERRGGDAGYMVMFEVPDVAAARARAAAAGIREVFAVDLPDIVDVHLHPRDVGGAIVAIDRPDPPGSWRWGGPAWEGAIPPHGPGGATGVELSVADPVSTAARWAGVLGAAVAADGTTVELAGGGAVRFTGPAGAGGDRITGFDVAVRPELAARHRSVEMGGVRFALSPAAP